MPKQARTYEDEFVAVVCSKFEYLGLRTHKQRAEALGVHEKTLSRYLNPKDHKQQQHMPLWVLRRMRTLLKLTDEEYALSGKTGRMRLS